MFQIERVLSRYYELGGCCKKGGFEEKTQRGLASGAKKG
jgi:hypothetical protein